MEPVVIVDYDPSWRTVFEQLRMILQQHLGDLALSIEHVGSTSIPGLSAKPIIDIDVVIESADSFPEVAEILSKLGYWHKGNLGIQGREAFGREGVDVPRTDESQQWLNHHLYVCAKDCEELARHRAFRDYLIRHPETMKKYEELKKQLAECYKEDRVAYTFGKTEFINMILNLAYKEMMKD